MSNKIEEIKNIYRYMSRHQLEGLDVYKRFLSWQLFEKKKSRQGKIIDWIEGRKLKIYPSSTSATGNYYFGLYEFEPMSFLLHYVREEDFFADCGANVGVYSILLAKECKRVVSFEPATSTVPYLRENIKINGYNNVGVIQKGLSNEEKMIRFTTGLDCANHIIEDDELAEYDENTVEIINTVRLDDVFSEDCPSIVKIDCEGVEKQILEGAAKTLSNKNLNVVVMEIFDNEFLERIMREYGFGLYKYNAFNRNLSPVTTYQTEENGIFVRDFDVADRRVKEAKKYRINKWEI